VLYKTYEELKDERPFDIVRKEILETVGFYSRKKDHVKKLKKVSK